MNVQADQSTNVMQFNLRSKDGLAVLSGQFDVPAKSRPEKMPVVIFVGGTGLFDRDYNYGNSDSDKDLLFKQLSVRLNKANFATVRFDYRGIHCNERTAPICETCKTKDDFKRNFVAKCIDNKVRGTVTADNIRDDVESIYEYVSKSSMINANEIIIFSHSEGTLHTSNLISRRRINPKGLLMMGFVAHSASEIYKWQFTSRLIAGYWEMDLNGNGFITNSEVSEFCQKFLIPEDRCLNLRPADGMWTKATIEAAISDLYEKSRSEVLTHSDREAFQYVDSKFGAVFASYGWWKLFFTDSTQTYKWLIKASLLNIFRQ